MKKIKNWFLDFFKGIAIGIACIIPGVSGGTLAIILRCYDKIVNSVSNIFKHFVNSFLVLLPIAIGCVIAVAAAWIPLHYAFENMMVAIVALFAGLIIGGLPGITPELKGGKVLSKHIIIAIVAFVIAVMMGVTSILISEFGGDYSVQGAFDNPQWWLFVVLIPVGMLASFALIVPGISGSMLLLVIGFYKPLLAIPTSIKDGTMSMGSAIGILACLAVGVIIGFFLFSKLMSFLLSKHRRITFYAIFGFIVGSIPALFLNKDIWEYYTAHGVATWEYFVAALLLISGFAIAFVVTKLASKNKVDDEKVEISQ